MDVPSSMLLEDNSIQGLFPDLPDMESQAQESAPQDDSESFEVHGSKAFKTDQDPFIYRFDPLKPTGDHTYAAPQSQAVLDFKIEKTDQFSGYNLSTGKAVMISLKDNIITDSEIKIEEVLDMDIPVEVAQHIYNSHTLPSSFIQPQIKIKKEPGLEMIPTPPPDLYTETVHPKTRTRGQRPNTPRRRAVANKYVQKHRAIKKEKDMHEEIEEKVLEEEYENLQHKLDDPFYVLNKFTPPPVPLDIQALIDTPRRKKQSPAPNEEVKKQRKNEENKFSRQKTMKIKKYKDEERKAHIKFLRKEISDLEARIRASQYTFTAEFSFMTMDIDSVAEN